MFSKFLTDTTNVDFDYVDKLEIFHSSILEIHYYLLPFYIVVQHQIPFYIWVESLTVILFEKN